MAPESRHRAARAASAALHTVGGGAGDKRRHYPAFAAAPGDLRHDRAGRIPPDEAQAAAYQHGPRRTSGGGGFEIALEQGLIGGAGFDVTLPEPPPPDSPLMRIARRPNVIVTPHIAWASDEAQQTLADQLIDNIENFVAGKPTNLVTGSY